MTVKIERNGPVTTIVMHRPEVKNAVDPTQARALHRAFLAFDADPDAAVAVFYGDNGSFCAGYDLKALSSGKARTGPTRSSSRTIRGPRSRPDPWARPASSFRSR